MYSVLLSFTAAFLVGFGGFFLGLWHWVWAILFTLVLFVAVWILLARRINKRLEPALTNLRRLMEQQRFDHALQHMRDLLPASRWIPMLRGQLLAQMGVLEYQRGNQDEAVRLLQQSSRKAADAQVFLASVLYRRGDKHGAFKTLQVASLANKKHPLVHNVHAWLLHKERRTDDAIEVLARYTKRNAADETGRNNLLRLQNKNRMNMKPLGMLWYALGFERPPPEMGQVRGRKGFRQPPMRRGG